MKKAAPPSGQVSLWFLFWTFLKIGSVAFGGFTALISVVENSMVRNRRLLHTEDMLDGISLAMLLPGPVAVNVVAFVGYRLRGGLGALMSSVGVILPSFFLLVGLSHVYLQYGDLPAVRHAFAGFAPAVSAIIITTAWGMSRKAVTSWPQLIIGITAALVLLGIGGFYITLAIIVVAGTVGFLLYGGSSQDDSAPMSPAGLGGVTVDRPAFSTIKFFLALTILAGLLVVYSVFLPVLGNNSLSRIFFTFSGMSLMLFGGGFVFIPLIQEVVVDGVQWVSQNEFISAIAMGQVTPGPILISAAFIGYKVKGFLGAALATFAIFFPPALLMVNTSRILDRIKQSQAVQGSLKGIRAGVVGMVFAAAVVVGRDCQFHWASVVIFVGCMVALLRFRVDILYIIPTAGILGAVLY